MKEKIITTNIINFAGGASSDIRDIFPNKFSITKHFDIFTNPSKLIPHRDMEDDNTITGLTTMADYDVTDFVVGQVSTTDQDLFAMGVKGGGSNLTKIFVKTSPINGAWTAPANAEASAGNIVSGNLVEYKSYLWGFHLNNKLFKYGDITGAATFTDQVSTTSATITSTAQGIIGPDDILYMPYNNIIGRVNAAGSFTDSVLTLPSKYRITSICNYGNSLAIACCIKDPNLFGDMKVYIWDRDSSLSTVTDIIDFGEGNDLKIGIVDGYLVGMVKKYPNAMVWTNAGAIIVKVVYGNTAHTIFERRESSTSILGKALSKGNKMYVLNNCRIIDSEVSGVSQGTNGIWCIKRNFDGTWAITVDKIFDNVSSTTIVGYGNFADYWWISDTNGNIVKTNDASTGQYTFNSVYESQIFDGKLHGLNASYYKKLIGVTVNHEKLPTDGSVLLSYKIDGGSSWTTIFTNTTDDSLSHSSINIESSGATLPQYQEIEFRIVSTGGAVITGLSFQEKIIDKRLY